MKYLTSTLLILLSLTSFAEASYCKADAAIVAKRMLFARSLARAELTYGSPIKQAPYFKSIEDVTISSVEIVNTSVDETTGVHQEELLVTAGEKNWDEMTVKLTMQFGPYYCDVISPITIN